MKVESIESTRSPQGKLRVRFDDGSSLMVLPSAMAELGLYQGMEIPDGALDSIKDTCAKASARERAVRIISAASVSKRDLERRLTQKGESETDAQNAVRWLEDLNLLDDAATARQIVARGAARGYGAERIKQLLWEKRIPRKYWDEALKTLPDMTEALETFLRARLGEAPDEKTLRSATQAAARRGFTWSEIHEALDKLNDEL